MPQFRAILLLLLALVAGSRAEQVTLTPVPLLFIQADVVLHGKVEDVSTLKDAQGEIFTEIAFKKIAAWKGTVDESRDRIVHSGGVLGEEMALASGQVEFLPGEEFVAFLVRNARGELVTIGMNLGKFRIEHGAAVRLHEKLSLTELKLQAQKVSK